MDTCICMVESLRCASEAVTTLLISYVCVRVCMLSHFSHVWLFATPWTLAHQVPQSMGFPRQEYWSGLPSPHLGDLPTQGWNPHLFMSPALAGRFFTASTTWEVQLYTHQHKVKSLGKKKTNFNEESQTLQRKIKLIISLGKKIHWPGW